MQTFFYTVKLLHIRDTVEINQSGQRFREELLTLILPRNDVAHGILPTYNVTLINYQNISIKLLSHIQLNLEG